VAHGWGRGFGEVGVVGDMARGQGHGFGKVGVVGDVARGSDGVRRFDSRVGVVVEVACGGRDMGVVGDVACNGAALTTWYAVGALTTWYAVGALI